MNENYKILEFRNKNIGYQYVLLRNNKYGNADQESGMFTVNELLNDNTTSVKDGSLIVTLVEKNDGQVLSIGDLITNTNVLNKQKTIISFILKSDELLILVNESNPTQYWTIRNSNLIDKKETKPEILLPLVIEKYTLQNIEIVLSKALDKPEVDTIICDFIKYKQPVDNVLPIVVQEPVKSTKMPDKWHVVITKENRRIIRNWSGGSYAFSIGSKYGLNNGSPWRQSGDYKVEDSIEISTKRFIEFLEEDKYYDKYDLSLPIDPEPQAIRDSKAIVTSTPWDFNEFSESFFDETI